MDYENIIRAFFSAPVARVKEMRNGRVHVAFADGAMTAFGPEAIRQMAQKMDSEEILKRYITMGSRHKTFNASYLIH